MRSEQSQCQTVCSDEVTIFRQTNPKRAGRGERKKNVRSERASTLMFERIFHLGCCCCCYCDACLYCLRHFVLHLFPFHFFFLSFYVCAVSGWSGSSVYCSWASVRKSIQQSFAFYPIFFLCSLRWARLKGKRRMKRFFFLRHILGELNFEKRKMCTW